MQNIRAADHVHVLRYVQCLLMLCALCLTSPTRAEVATAIRVPMQTQVASSAATLWLQRSPVGGDIVDVAYSPVDRALMLAAHIDTTSGTSGTLYRSTDEGASWSVVPGMASHPVHDIEFAADGRAFVATGDGVLTSGAIDSPAARARWTRLELGIGLNDAVLDVAIDPSQRSVLWVGITDAQGTQPVNVMRSGDGGHTWSNRTPPMSQPMSCREIAFDPLDPRRMVAVFGGDFGGGQVWTSENSGASWTQRSSGLPNRPIRSTAFGGRRLYVGGGIRLGQQDFGVYVSEDFGRSWMPLHQANWPLLAVESIAIAPTDPNLILVATDGSGVHRSHDGGQSWQLAVSGTESMSVRSVRFRPGSGDRVAIGSIGQAVKLSRNAGLHFDIAAQGIHALNVRALAIDPFDDRHLAIAVASLNSGAVYSSIDAGLSWSVERLPATRFNSVRFANDGTLYAVSGGPSSVAPEGLYVRSAAGSWRALGPDQGSMYETDIKAIRLSTIDPDLIVLAGSDRGASVGNEGTLWRSQDRGAHWTKVYESFGAGVIGDVELIEHNGAVRMLAGFDDAASARNGRVLRSEDGGTTWRDASAGLPAVLSDLRLCFSEVKPDIVYLGATLGNWKSRVFRSENAGDSWRAVGVEGSLIADLACDPRDAETLYVSRRGNIESGTRLERSRDGGLSFTDFSSGVAELRESGELAINLAAGGGIAVFLGTSRGSFVARVNDLPDGM
ncbi:MAG: hypothetical protein SGI99_17170 [Pseudomonadota bacterium]|nr:hypothetical protein [Pseudomonadota bacterium]